MLLAGSFYYMKDEAPESRETEAAVVTSTPIAAKEKKDRIEQIEITENSTFGNLLSENGVDYGLAMEIYEASRDVYDLVKIRVGRNIELVYDKDTDELRSLVYQVDTEERLYVDYVSSTTEVIGSSSEAVSEMVWQAELRPIPYETKMVAKEGVVESSMYQAALDNDIDIRAIIDMANAFQWSIDFAMDPRQGDTFKFVYEERWLDGEYVMPAQIYAAEYVNEGEKIELFYFEESDENKGFFDKDGNSAQKMFLKAPVAFKYISSGYTTGNRVIMEYGLSGPHRAIDYAAAIGTPIRAVGDGKVTYAGWNSGGYGYLTKIRHNGTYSTNYAHQSKIAVKVGQRVVQGETIGYVGSTGYSTGPHLHYEMVKNGVKINPLKEVLPPGEPIKEENRARFEEEMEKWRGMLE